MKQNIISKNSLQSVKVVILALALSVGIAMAWTGPTQPPPNGNAEAPINVSSASQEKSGYLSIGKNSQNPLASLEVWKNSTTGGVIWGGALGLSGDANVGGNLAANAGVFTDVVDIGNDLTVGKTAIVGSLSQANNPGINYPMEVCADSNGQLVLCGIKTGTAVYTKDKFGVQTFTANNCPSCTANSFVPPQGISNLSVKVWGASGGGGAYIVKVNNNTVLNGLGGGGGEYRTGTLPTNLTYTVVVGTRGTGGVYNATNHCDVIVASACDGTSGAPSEVYSGNTSILSNGGGGGRTYASSSGAGGTNGTGGTGNISGGNGGLITGGSSYLNISNGGDGGSSASNGNGLAGATGRVEFYWN